MNPATRTAHLYELGIPVVETDIRWHISVGQKIPLNTSRDNVTPAYFRMISTAVAEAMRADSIRTMLAAGQHRAR